MTAAICIVLMLAILAPWPWFIRANFERRYMTCTDCAGDGCWHCNWRGHVAQWRWK